MFRTVNSNDRFIPRRIQVNVFNNHSTTESWASSDSNEEAEFVNYAKLNYNRHNYKNTLRTILFPIDTKILNFFPPKKFTPADYTVTKNELLWPVKGRKKPSIGQPEMILDMPQFDTNICHHVADWSCRDCLATIFENEVHMWYPNTEPCRAVTLTMKRVQNCVKWRPDGKTFAMGLLPNHVGIWDIETKMVLCETDCCVPFCEVLCLEWASDHLLLVGCSRGCISLFAVHNKFKFLKQARHDFEHKILNLVCSSDKRYVASTGMDREVTVWRVPELKIHFTIKCGCIVRGLAWHPWKNSMLALNLSNNNEGRISLWNINSFKRVANERLPYEDCSVDMLTFNPLSGELVVSYFVRDPKDRATGKGIIAVLTTLVNIVEEIYSHGGPILYLLWGSGGNVLASASADENLCLWDFFGTKENKLKSTKKKEVCDHHYIATSTLLRATIR